MEEERMAVNKIKISANTRKVLTLFVFNIIN